MARFTRRGALTTLTGAAATVGIAQAQPRGATSAFSPEAVDGTVRRFMAAFDIPGVAVAVVRPGAKPFVGGYGVRRLGDPAPVDGRTEFAIGSNSKAFLAAGLAMLVEEGKLGWDEPLVKYLPEFEMADPCVTQMFTVRDLLVHRSGLPLGAGDLMQFPAGDHTAEELMHALRYFKLVRGFRAGFAYDNILYVVAGVLLKRVSGTDWDAFVPRRIFQPLGMTDAASNLAFVNAANVAARHAKIGPPARGFGRVEIISTDETPVVGPAGGVNVSAESVTPWLNVQLAKGALPAGGRLWTEASAEEMWTPQTIVRSGPGPTPQAPDRAVIAGYALGWGVQDYRGHRLVSHGGGVEGQVTAHALLPDDGVGLAVYGNLEDGYAVPALRSAILDLLLDAPPYDWVAATQTRKAEAQTKVTAVVGDGDFKVPTGGRSLPLPRYAGRYRDPWYGDIVVGLKGERLTIDFTRTPKFKSALEPFGPDAFRTRFGRGVGEDAIVTFVVKDAKVVAVTMTPLSPLADFSFDFQHLAFTPVAS